MDLALELRTQGVVCIPLYTRTQLHEHRVRFDMDISAMPELKPPHPGETLEDRPLVGGGTSFVGGSICHAPSTRQVELDAYTAARTVLEDYARRWGAFSHLAQVKDRVCFRPRGLQPAAETSHRDLSPNSPTGSYVIFGGWVPLNDEDGQEQFFSCVPGSHTDECARDDKGGFRSLTDAEKRAYRARMQRTKIPLGHMILFDQRIVHEVVADKKPYAIRRVFTAFELSRGDAPLPLMQRVSSMTAADVALMWETQGPFPLKSGQECRTFPKLWAVNWRDRLAAFSKQRVRKWVRDPRKDGRVLHIFPAPPRHLRHPAYTEAEKARYVPAPIESAPLLGT